MTATDTANEVTLKEAVRLCGKSEKTLRRKIEAGNLEGRREPLEYGGFMWLVDLASLEQLYPGSSPVEGATEPPPTRLATVPPSAPTPPPSEPAENQNRFFDYLMDENRDLKDDLRERDVRIANLQDKTARLERQLGEQEGTATTQSRVLEWFQRQDLPRALPPGPEPVETPAKPSRRQSRMPSLILGALAVLGTALAVLMLCGQINFVG